MIRSPAIALLAAALALPSCRREALPPGADFLRYVQRDAEVLLYVGDLLPHLDAALRSERLMGVLRDGPAGIDPARLRLQLQAVREYVPSRACLSVPRGGMVALGAVWRALEAGTRCRQAVRSGGRGLRAAQEDLAAAIADLEGARASLYVAFREPRTAEALFDRLLDMRGLWAMNPALEVKEKLDALQLGLRPGGFAEGRMFDELLSGMGLVASREDPGVDLLREAAAPLRARITIELAVDGLVCTLGAMSGSSPAELDALWGNEPLPLAYLQWDLAALRSAMPEPAVRTVLPFGPALPHLVGLTALSHDAPATGALRVDLGGGELVLVAEHPPSRDGSALVPPQVFERLPAGLDVRRKSSRTGTQERFELRISLRR